MTISLSLLSRACPPSNVVVVITVRGTLPIQAHVQSKSYKKASWYAADYSKYLPHIVPHKKDPKKLLYCTVTRRTLNKIPNQVEKHVNGHKFKRKLAMKMSEKGDEKDKDNEEDILEEGEDKMGETFRRKRTPNDEPSSSTSKKRRVSSPPREVSAS